MSSGNTTGAALRGAVIAGVAMFAAACNTTSPARSSGTAGLPGTGNGPTPGVAGGPAPGTATVPGGSLGGLPGGSGAGQVGVPGPGGDGQADIPGAGGDGQSGNGKSDDEILAEALEALDRGAGAAADDGAADSGQAPGGKQAGAAGTPAPGDNQAGVAGQPGDAQTGSEQAAGGGAGTPAPGGNQAGVASRPGDAQTGSEQAAGGQPGGGAAGGGRTEGEILAAALAALERGGAPGASSPAGAPAPAGDGGGAGDRMALEKKLNEQLAEFDRTMLGERDAIAGKANQDGYRGSLDDGEEPLKTAPTEDSPPPAGRGNAPIAGSGRGTSQSDPRTPPDLADAEGDDIIARQLREAALKEQDPALREKLWEEYRKYKRDLK